MSKLNPIRNLKYLIFFLIPCILYAREEIEIQDYTGDSIPDTLLISSSSGSGASSIRIILRNGKSGESDTLLRSGSYAQFRDIVPISKRLQSPTKTQTLKLLQEKILPPLRKKADPSLQWIENGLSSYKSVAEPSLIEQIITITPSWYAEIEMPSTYTLRKDSTFWVYYGHNHYRNNSGDSLVIIDANRNDTLFRTSHGLLLYEKHKGYRWLFITDCELTGGPAKLRWESIGKLQRLDEEHLLLLQRTPVYGSHSLFIIHIPSGTIGKLRLPNRELQETKIDKTNLIVYQEGEEIRRATLKKLFKDFKVAQ